jgi:CBS domain-containing protein
MVFGHLLNRAALLEWLHRPCSCQRGGKGTVVSTIQGILEKKGPHVVSIGREATVLDAAKLMNEHRIGALVVTHGEKVVGIFSERDILNRVVARQRDPATTPVREVMTSPVACCTPQTTRAECRNVMRNRRIRHLPVVKDGRLVGIISIGDIQEVTEAEQQETIRYLHEYLYGDWGG